VEVHFRYVVGKVVVIGGGITALTAHHSPHVQRRFSWVQVGTCLGTYLCESPGKRPSGRASISLEVKYLYLCDVIKVRYVARASRATVLKKSRVRGVKPCIRSAIHVRTWKTFSLLQVPSTLSSPLCPSSRWTRTLIHAIKRFSLIH
jgi:hypothetical protein